MGLLSMLRYATGTDCRRQSIQQHFDGACSAANCGFCDVCLPVDTFSSATCPPPAPCQNALPNQSTQWFSAAIDLGARAWLVLYPLGA